MQRILKLNTRNNFILKWTKDFIQEDIQMTNKYTKRCSIARVIMGIQNTTGHLLEWQNPEHWQHQMLVRMWSHRKFHPLLVRIQHETATLEGSLTVSHKTKYTLTIWSSNHTLWYLPKGVEKHMSIQKLAHGCL